MSVATGTTTACCTGLQQALQELSETNQTLHAQIGERRLAEAQLRDSEVRYRQLFDANPMPLWVYDLQSLAFLAVNDAAVDLYGYSRERFLAMTIADIRPPADVPLLRASVARGPARFSHSGTWRHVKADGTRIDVEITSHEIEFAGRPARLVLAIDVTARLEQERRIARLSRLRGMIGGIGSAMLRLRDRDSLLSEACRVAVGQGGFPLSWIVGVNADATLADIVAFDGEDPSLVELARSVRRLAVHSQLPSCRAARSGRPQVVNDILSDVSLTPLHDELVRRGYLSCAALPLVVDDAVAAVLVLLAREAGSFDEDEMALLEWMSGDIGYALGSIARAQRLNHLAYYDALTGLANAQLFRDRLDQFVYAAQENGGEVGVAAIDLEHFTAINDAHGREAGDELLIAVAERLQATLTEPYALGRIGADTFVVARPGDHDAVVRRLPDDILAALAQPFAIDGREIHVTAQLGVALYPHDGGDGSAVFRNAEVALKLARSSGERCMYYSCDLHQQVAKRLELERQLRAAIDANEFVLHYQARVDMISGELVGAEALLRWQHPQRGLVGPGEFVGVAEDTGLIVPIGAWVIRAVCAQQAAWLAAGVAAVPVAINVSSIQFEKGDLVQTVRQALADNALAPRHLQIELTESAVMADVDAAARILETLHALGIGLSLDDFGTGYSSLAHLKRFPFDAVKIDGSFIANVTRNPDDAAIAGAIIAMSHRLGLKVVAECVETQGQFNYLREHGCDEMQGFHFSRPVPGADFAALLRTGKRIRLPASQPGDCKTVLIVDDERGVRSALMRVLRRDGYRLLDAASGPEALDLLAVNRVHLIISDQRMPEMSGTEFLDIVKRLYPDTLRIVLSGYTDLAVVTDSVNRGAVYRFLTKPWDDDTLRAEVRDALHGGAGAPAAARTSGLDGHAARSAAAAG